MVVRACFLTKPNPPITITITSLPPSLPLSPSLSFTNQNNFYIIAYIYTVHLYIILPRSL